jgi:hypothetical protein
MLKIYAEVLSDIDKEVIRKYCHFVLNWFLTPEKIDAASITIRVIGSDSPNLSDKEKKELKEYKAWCITGQGTGNRPFSLTINADQIKKNRKRIFTRLRDFLICLGHELVHVTQYLKGELIDTEKGEKYFVHYRGKKYHYDDEDIEKYWFAPWELAAYGYEQGLYAVFKKRYKKGEL